jgi:hypothetical protein
LERRIQESFSLGGLRLTGLNIDSEIMSFKD